MAQTYEAVCRTPLTDRQRGYATHCCKQAGNGKAPCKNTTSMVSWSAFHREWQKNVNTRCQSLLLPLFAEAAHSKAMIKHAITVVMCLALKSIGAILIFIIIKAVEHLNPGQAAVIEFDQPLYALPKQMQKRYPDTMGEDKLVVMLGGLHIQLAVLKAVGSWLLGSGCYASQDNHNWKSWVISNVWPYYAYKICPSCYGILALYT